MISTLRRLQYAAGFIELGMLQDAAGELRAIPRVDEALPQVLTVRIDLHMQARQWKQVLMVARKLVKAAPNDDKGWICWAFALRELNQIKEARELLREALPLHGKTCDVLHYNLACYECLLGNLPDARRHLQMATRKDKQWRISALDDADLEALWPEIKRMSE